MKNKQNRCAAWVSRLVLGLGLGSILLLPSVARAQADPSLNGAGSSNAEIDPARSLIDLIQRGQVGPTQSTADFIKGQDENLNDAAAAFRARQREAFKVSAPAVESASEDEQLQSKAIDETPRRALW